MQLRCKKTDHASKYSTVIRICLFWNIQNLYICDIGAQGLLLVCLFQLHFAYSHHDCSNSNDPCPIDCPSLTVTPHLNSTCNKSETNFTLYCTCLCTISNSGMLGGNHVTSQHSTEVIFKYQQPYIHVQWKMIFKVQIHVEI